MLSINKLVGTFSRLESSLPLVKLQYVAFSVLTGPQCNMCRRSRILVVLSRIVRISDNQLDCANPLVWML